MIYGTLHVSCSFRRIFENEGDSLVEKLINVTKDAFLFFFLIIDPRDHRLFKLSF